MRSLICIRNNSPRLYHRIYVSQRYWSNTASCQSGHNRWSTIKHDKGKNDAVKNKQFSVYAKDIAAASKLFGPDLRQNPRLGLIIANAKKAGFPKASIEAAVARGQGSSASGKPLENVTVEAIIPPSVGVIVECQTESKLRLLQALKLLIKNYGGSLTPTNYLFERKGRIAIHKEPSVNANDVFDVAIDLAALDITEASDDYIVVMTTPNDTQHTAKRLSEKLSAKIRHADIIWDPIEDTKVILQDMSSVENLTSFLGHLREEEGVQDVYLNLSRGSLSDNIWADVNKSLNI